MDVHGVAGVQVQLLVLMVLDCGNISVGDGLLWHVILYEIGDGSRVKFWRDRWCGETPLAASYPELYRFCRDKEASAAELMKFTNGVLHWDVSFFRAVHNR